MKITCLLPLLTFTLLFGACTIHKRVHRPGYHISHPFKHKRITPKNIHKPQATLLPSSATIDSLKTIQLNTPSKLTATKSNENTSAKAQLSRSTPPKAQTRKVKDSSASKNQDVTKDVQHTQKLRKKNFAPTLTTKDQKISSRKLAITIGLALLFMALLAGLSVPILNKVLSTTSPLTTFTQIGANKSSFLGALFGWIGIFLLDLLVAWGVWKYYKEDDKQKAKTSGILRLIYSILLGVAILQLFKSYSAGTALVAHQSLTNFFTLWNVGLIVFGIHLMVLAFLYKADTEKKWLTIALSIALFLGGLGYVLQYATYFLFPQQLIISTTIESLFIVFMILGELGYAVWMLFKGGR